MSDLLTSYLAASATLPGWFFHRSIVIWDCLLCFQQAQGIRGNLLEIGVWRGKSALLCALHAKEDECCWFVDPVLHSKTEETLQQATAAQCLFVRDNSATLHRSPLLTTKARTFRWLHIDGEHSGTAVYDDMNIACQLLHEQGVLVLDDFFSPIWPQITKAAFDYCSRHDHEISMFLCGDNKGYFCRPRNKAMYMDYIHQHLFHEMQERKQDNFTICKTTVSDDMNCFGIVNRFKDRNYVGPDWAEDSIAGG